LSAGQQRLRFEGATLRPDSVQAAGRDVSLDVPGEERAELASRLGVASIESLRVSLHAVRFRGGFRVTGRLEADLTQPSVISLEPVPQHVEEPIDRVFLPGGERDFAGPANAEVFVDLDGEDLPDHFEGGAADLSELIIETLALAVDPYPRAEGEKVEDVGLPDSGTKDNPFAELARLKRPPEDR
jgi:uncharacterized metal-binding protein YceD (DUF177 family)